MLSLSTTFSGTINKNFKKINPPDNIFFQRLKKAPSGFAVRRLKFENGDPFSML